MVVVVIVAMSAHSDWGYREMIDHHFGEETDLVVMIPSREETDLAVMIPSRQETDSVFDLR